MPSNASNRFSSQKNNSQHNNTSSSHARSKTYFPDVTHEGHPEQMIRATDVTYETPSKGWHVSTIRLKGKRSPFNFETVAFPIEKGKIDYDRPVSYHIEGLLQEAISTHETVVRVLETHEKPFHQTGALLSTLRCLQGDVQMPSSKSLGFGFISSN